jgi:Protein of unknown function (DUF1353)
MKQGKGKTRMRSTHAPFGSLLVIFLGLSQAVAAQQPAFGEFKGRVVVSFLPDGRNVKLEEPFGYIDPAGKHWDVPAGMVTDGASIPQVFWITHPPFTGQYRSAAVIHDHYCQTKSARWQDVHTVFYNAMRASGVEERTAKVMYAAVYNFGPRWGPDTGRRGPTYQTQNVNQQKEFMRALDAWIERDNPSPVEISAAIDAGRIPQ